LECFIGMVLIYWVNKTTISPLKLLFQWDFNNTIQCEFYTGF